MDKEKVRKEFNEFLDSASDETIKDFLKFIKERKAKRNRSGRDTDSPDKRFNNRSN